MLGLTCPLARLRSTQRLQLEAHAAAQQAPRRSASRQVRQAPS